MVEDYDLSRSLNLISLICIIGSFEGLLIGEEPKKVLEKKGVVKKVDILLGSICRKIEF